MEDIQIAQPTVIVGVPRVLNRLYDAITSKFAALPDDQKVFLEQAKAEKLENLKKGIFTHPVYDEMFFNGCKNMIGGKIRVIVTGAAPIKGETLMLLEIYF